MKAYLLTTGILFAVVTLAHAWEVIDRRHLIVDDAVVFPVTIGMTVWAWRLARRRA
jgi:hypothetical protein